MISLLRKRIKCVCVYVRSERVLRWLCQAWGRLCFKVIGLFTSASDIKELVNIVEAHREKSVMFLKILISNFGVFSLF